ncbi:MAG: AlpA family transcriptional regulator [Marinobacterium sp.]|nr:AlpA family transcriptional regulator [Marinobacterium sp.]
MEQIIQQKNQIIAALQRENDELKAQQASAQPHPDDVAVDVLATAMKAKLALKRAQGFNDWTDPLPHSNDDLAQSLVDHLAKGDPVDIANYAMFLYLRNGGDSLKKLAPGNRILRRKEVEEITGLGRSTIYEHMAKDTFPKPVSLTGRAVGWRNKDIQHWLQEQASNLEHQFTDNPA